VTLLESNERVCGRALEAQLGAELGPVEFEGGVALERERWHVSMSCSLRASRRGCTWHGGPIGVLRDQ
jgi:hypothetical protein